jgi:WhiB family redox-sensing transcriptional regulator
MKLGTERRSATWIRHLPKALEDLMDTEWMAAGNCAHEPPATFFPSDGVGVEVARRICDGCPVKEPCLEHALAHRIDHGVWGGCSERERRRILKQRRVAGMAGAASGTATTG